MELSQLCAANYHYKRYTLDYFLESAERLGYQSIELWASGPHLHLEDFDTARLAELNRKIKAHHLALRCFTPEQCVYAISVSHPDKVYRDRTVDFFNQHIEAAVQLDCDHMVVSTGFAYLDVDAEDAFGWCAEAMGRIARKAEQEGVTLAVEPFTKYTTHICNEASQLRRLLQRLSQGCHPHDPGSGGLPLPAGDGRLRPVRPLHPHLPRSEAAGAPHRAGRLRCMER